MKKLPKKCLCGKDMHISKSQLFLYDMMKRSWGEKKRVMLWQDRAIYLIPTYYIIVHGIKYDELKKLKLEIEKN